MASYPRISFLLLSLISSSLLMAMEAKDLERNITASSGSSASQLTTKDKEKERDDSTVHGEDVKDNLSYSTGPFRTITLDGGGIRGTAEASFLACLQEELENRLECGVHLAEAVDLIAGTSTGALIAIELNIPNKDNTAPLYDARFMTEFYIKKGADLFQKGSYLYRKYRVIRSGFCPLYDRAKLDGLVQKIIGPKKPLLKDAFCSLIIPAYQTNIGSLIFFENDQQGEMEEAALATSAAPYYLGAYTNRNNVYLDGGLIANNPSLNIFKNKQVLAALNNPHRGVHLISLGAGKSAPVDHAALGENGGIYLARNVDKLLSLIMEGTSKNTDHILNTLSHNLTGKLDYRRLDFDVTNNEFDNIEGKVLAGFKSAGRKKFEETAGSELKEFIDRLVDDSKKGMLLKKRIKRHNDKHITKLLDLSCLPQPNINACNWSFDAITKLSLANTVRGAEAARPLLLSLKGNFPNVVTFDFSQNQLGIGDEESLIKAAMELMLFSQKLKILLLHSNSLAENAALAFELAAHGLEYLDLSHNEISNDTFADMITHMPSKLKLLNVINKESQLTLPENITIPESIQCLPVGHGGMSEDKFAKEFSTSQNNFILY